MHKIVTISLLSSSVGIRVAFGNIITNTGSGMYNFITIDSKEIDS